MTRLLLVLAIVAAVFALLVWATDDEEPDEMSTYTEHDGTTWTWPTAGTGYLYPPPTEV